MLKDALKTAGILLPLLVLSAGTWTDIREKSVDVRPILLAGLAGIMIRVIMIFCFLLSALDMMYAIGYPASRQITVLINASLRLRQKISR